MSSDAANFTGSIPEHYDRGLGPIIFADFAADLARRTVACKPARVLEIAAGTGIVSRALRDLLPASVPLVVTDLNPPMLDVARRKLGSGEAVDFKVADASTLPFPEASFDAVVCQFGVMFFPEKDKSYLEVHRVLAPGGRYHFNVWDSPRHNPFGRIAHDVLGSFFPADPPQFYTVPFSYHELDPIKNSLTRAGFTDIVIDIIGREKEIEDIALFARGLVYGNPAIDQIRARGGTNPEHIVEALAKALRQEFGADPGRMPLQAIVCSAGKPSA